MRYWKIGELARDTGVTIRALHHYDEIGLLRPKQRSPSNYRQYSEADVLRLQQIVSLRHIGLSLEEIRHALADADCSPLSVLERHLERLREEAEAARALCDRLERLVTRLRAAEEVSVDELIQTMEMTTMFEKYYTPEQLQELEARAKSVGKERMEAAGADWARLGEEVRLEMERGTDPAHERVQALARRWQALIDEFTGGNPEIRASLNKMYASEAEVHGMQTGPMREMGEYIQRALAAG